LLDVEELKEAVAEVIEAIYFESQKARFLLVLRRIGIMPEQNTRTHTLKTSPKAGREKLNYPIFINSRHGGQKK
jgi:hypothetical protein